jgi:predicted  nucleic acid-binding Zn-ribbon protein
MKIFGWLRTRWYCPMCGAKVRVTPTTITDDRLGFARPSAPCPNCGYDPYEPMAESRWRRQEEQAQPAPEEHDENAAQGVDPEAWRQIVIEAREAGAWLDARRREELDENEPPPGVSSDSWRRIVTELRQERALEAEALRRAQEKEDDG